MREKNCMLDNRPIYRQIAGQIAADIVCRNLQPGQQLQSIRQLSLRYHATPNTVQRAADVLKRERLLTKRRHGLFVTSDIDLISRFRQQQCGKLVTAFSLHMSALGFSPAETRQMIRQLQNAPSAEPDVQCRRP